MTDFGYFSGIAGHDAGIIGHVPPESLPTRWNSSTLSGIPVSFSSRGRADAGSEDFHATLQLLWAEYVERHGDNARRYSQFCHHYRLWRGRQRRSMRQVHRAGEKIFIDYCGPTVPVVDRSTGEMRKAQVFVAVLGASSYTFAEATWSQSLPDWIASHQRMLAFYGGVPELLVPDNLKAAVTKADRYTPQINETYAELAAHYQTAVLPARPYKPKDKAKAEAAVLLVERWILARLRRQAAVQRASRPGGRETGCSGYRYIC